MPAMEVDLALIVPDSVTSLQVAETIRQSAGDLLESLDVFDEFRGAGIPAGSRSLAWRLTFRHPERTLRDREIQGRTTKILSTLEAALGIKQRTS
jgi:phenylalanyl-tRNA synthetase beta chain